MVWWRRVDSDESEATPGGGAPVTGPPEPDDRPGAYWLGGDQRAGERPGASAEPAPPDPVPEGQPAVPLEAPEVPSPALAVEPRAAGDTLGSPSHSQVADVSAQTSPERHAPMADYQSSLNEAMQIDGALGAALVDSQSGMALATAGNPDGLDLGVAAAGNSNVVQAKLRTMRDLGLNQKLEDILITLETQYHIIRTFSREEGIFLYLVLDKARSNLAMARFKLASIEKQLVI